MNVDNSFLFQDAIDFINTCYAFTHKDGRISTPFSSKIFIVLLIFVYIAVFYALKYLNTKYRYLDFSETIFLAVPIMIVLGILLNYCITTNKVIDYKNNLIYCELLIFNILICRYGYINGDDIAAVGNNVSLFQAKGGIRYTYYTSILLKDGTLNNFFDFGSFYSAAYNLAIVLANYFHKPLTVAGKEQQLTVSPGLRLSTLSINLKETENEYIIKSVVWVIIITVLALVLLMIKYD